MTSTKVNWWYVTGTDLKAVWDEEGDVFYLRRHLQDYSSRRCSDSDTEVLLEYNSSDTLIGVTVMGLKVLGAKWLDHPVRLQLPEDMAAAIDSVALGKS